MVFSFRLFLSIAAAAVLMATTSAVPVAAADNCTAWSTAKVQREEGKSWTASACAKRKSREALIEIVCYGSKWNIRYQPVLPGNADFEGVRDFVFRTSTGSRRLSLGFEGLDGAFATDLDRRHPVFEMMMSGDKVSIKETKGKVATQTYTLRGSRKALTKLAARCKG